ncbi:MAG: N-6 DNA methylase, partial [Myxococcales bacterium]|nr:N-6 DNA methylase [Myxococcales bacterium]
MSTDPHARFHAHWLGLVQPIEGLVFSIPVLVDAQAMDHQSREVRDLARELAPEVREAGPRHITDLRRFFAELLELDAPYFTDDLPEDLALYVAEGHQTLRPTFALRADPPREVPADASPAVQAGAAFDALIWDLPAPEDTDATALDLDRPEDTTGPWRAAPGSKFDRLLRACGVPIGLLTNRQTIRLVYAPVGQSTGYINFRLADMLSAGGAPILDAFVALLRADRWYSVAPERALPALLAQSRARQADVTAALAEQVFGALELLLDGFDRADARDPQTRFRRALQARPDDDDPVYAGLLTALLRLVVLLYAEAHGLLPVEHPLYAANLGLIDLFDRLVDDAGAFPDEMDRRFGAWPRLLATFRAVYFGAAWAGDAPLHMPPRQGDLFDPDRFPWLEGRDAEPLTLDPAVNAAVRTPAIDDATVLAVLQALLLLDGQRLSYRALDVEQIGSVYERLMGYSVLRMPAPALCLRPSRFWITAEAALQQPPAQRARWLQEDAGLPRAAAGRLADAIAAAEAAMPQPVASQPSTDATHGIAQASSADAQGIVLSAIADEAGYRDRRRPAGALVLQPGSERRRTSSHYTPRSLSAPIVARTLEPLLATLGEAPTAEQILSLTVCDPAMGSGAFLVESCRFLADRVVAAWTRDGTASRLAATVPDLHLHARRLVAQRCLYGVDKNRFAVELARLSLWLVTMARDLPFTFVDHALRHGDSLVGLSLDQIASFHWKPGRQLTLISEVIRQTLEDTVECRQAIQALADSDDTRQKRDLLDQAEYFTERVRLIADACVGAFFAEAKNPAREKERKRRLDLVERWLRDDEDAMEVEAELRAMQATLRAEVPAFHWMLAFPEVFWAERPDPLGGGEVGVAWMDAFVGNPPFMGGSSVSTHTAPAYRDWLLVIHDESHGNSDLSAHSFRRADTL